MAKSSKVVTTHQPVRLAFPSLAEPTAMEGSKPKFQATLIIDKGDKAFVSDLRSAINEAALNCWGSKENFPKGLKNPLRDGAEKEDRDGFGSDVYFLNAKANVEYPPRCVDNRGIEIPRADIRRTLYAGCYVNAKVQFFGYVHPTNRGVACGLLGIQFVRDGEPFGGTVVEFADIGGEGPSGVGFSDVSGSNVHPGDDYVHPSDDDIPF